MITYRGPFNTSAAIPTANRHLANALRRRGYDVLRNVHGRGPVLSDVFISFTYPPLVPELAHKNTLLIAAWEFWGDEGVPRSFRRVFKEYDVVAGISEWNTALYSRWADRTATVWLGFDPDEFYPGGPRADFKTLLPDQDIGAYQLLWVGGSDERHGLQTAIQVMEHLPPEYHLIAKLSVNYPHAQLPAHNDRVHILRIDTPSLAPLYRAASCLLLSARAVGFSLPALEALACGTPVVSSRLPPVEEFATENLFIADGSILAPYRQHPVHPDCKPYWLMPDVEALAEQVLQATAATRPLTVDAEWYQAHTWEAAGDNLMKILEEQFQYGLS